MRDRKLLRTPDIPTLRPGITLPLYVRVLPDGSNVLMIHTDDGDYEVPVVPARRT